MDTPMYKKKSLFPAIFLWLLTSTLCLLLFTPYGVVAQPKLSIPEFNFLPVVERADQDLEQVKGLVQTFESFGARYTASPGYKKARDFILNWFNQHHLQNVTTHPYNLTVLVDYGGSLTLDDGTMFVAHPLMPNVVAPVNVQNLTGPIVYVGMGELKDMDGKPISGSIVLMDFNSGFNWLNAAKLGAKAVIFLEPPTTNREQAMQKREEKVAYSFPRFYLESGEAFRLLRVLSSSPAPPRGSLSGRTRWEMRTAENIIGFVGGVKYPETWIVIGAYYDALSVVPAMSTGASEAVSMAIFLSLAKYYSENPPDYTLMFVAFSGHNQGIWGAREWMADYTFGPTYPPSSPHYQKRSIGENVICAFQINIIPDTPLLYTTTVGGFYSNPEGGGMPSDAIVLVMDSYNLLMKQTGKDYGLNPQGQFQNIQYAEQSSNTYIIQSPNYARWSDLETLQQGTGGDTRSKCPVYLFTTCRALDVFYYTPTDRYRAIEPWFPNVQSQMELLYTWLHTFLNIDYLKRLRDPPGVGLRGRDWSDVRYLGVEGLRQAHNVFMRNYVQAVIYNETTGWYTPLRASPDRQVLLTVYTAGHGSYSSDIQWRDRLAFVSLANESGVAEMVGECGEEGLDRSWEEHYMFNVYALDGDGKVIYARDFGQYALPQTISWHITGATCWGKANFNVRKVVVFPVGGFLLFDYVDPNYLDLSYLPIRLGARYHAGHTPLVHHNLATGESSYMYYAMGRSIAMAFVEPDVPVELILYSPYVANRPYCVFINATAENPDGYGYTVKQGQQVPISLFDYARDLYYIDEARTRVAEAAKMTGAYTKLHQKTGILLKEMREALNNHQYSRAYAKAIDTWGSEMSAYASLRGTLEGTVYTVPFFCALIIPFAYLAERLFLHFEGYRRLAAMIGIFLSLIAVFSLMHPGFVLSSSIVTVLVSFAIIALIIPALVVVGGQTSTMLSTIRRKALGVHIVEIGKVSFATTALSTGIENMRKTKFRTSLTLTSVLILSLALVLFTSVAGVQFTKVTEVPAKYKPPYEGVLLQREYYGSMEGFRFGVGVNALDYLQTRYGDEAIIAPRMWLWSPHGFATEQTGFLVVGPDYPAKGPIVVRAVLGLTPQEARLTGVEHTLIGNNSRWFIEEDLYTCVLSKASASLLGIPIDLPAKPVRVNLSGLNLTVVGIAGPLFDSIVDINGNPVTPLDFTVAGLPPAHAFSWEIIIVPFKLTSYLLPHWQAGYVRSLMISSVALKFHNVSATTAKSMEIFNSFMGSTIQVWSHHAGKVYMLTIARSVTSTGMAEQSLALILVGLTIFNLMLGTVHERRRDLFTYSSVGLSPIQVSLMFVAEALVYAILGSLIGYVIAMATGRLALTLGAAVGFMNYASEWVAGAIGVALLATLLSTIYPTIVASRVVTPSLERRWRLPTKPVGDEWTVPLPFYPSDEEEVRGILEYVREYFEHHRSPMAPEFSVSTLSLEKTMIAGFDAYVLEAETRIIPYELGIIQTTRIQTINKGGRWNVVIHLKRVAGSAKPWADHNRPFLTRIRGQFLLWRGLSREERAKYMKGRIEEGGT